MKYTRVNKQGSFSLDTRGENTLIAFDRHNRIAISGGGRQPEDQGMPLVTLEREDGEELGGNMEFKLVSTTPLVLCADTRTHCVVWKPAPGQIVDLRYIYRKVWVRGDELQEIAPDEMAAPQLVTPKFFRRKRPGIEIRKFVDEAIKAYKSVTCWPRMPECLHDQDLFGTLEEQLIRFNFAPHFIAEEVANHTLRSKPALFAQPVASRQLAMA